MGLSLLRTNAQVEYKGKVRVSSLHDAAVTNIARTLTPRFLRYISNFKEVHARRAEIKVLRSENPNALLGCADISDATGNNTHSENEYILGEVLKIMGLSLNE